MLKNQFPFVDSINLFIFVEPNVTKMNNRFAQFLAAENISQSQFADAIGVTRSSVSHILSGRNKPGSEFILGIMKKFPDLNIEWLLAGRGKMYKSKTLDNAEFSPAEDIAVKNPAPESEEKTEITEVQQNGELFHMEEAGTEKETVSKDTVEKPAESKMAPEKTIARVIIFYTDGTFVEVK